MKVAIMMGSASDMKVMKPAQDTLTKLGVPHVVRILSAHRTPHEVSSFVSTATNEGYGAIICGAGAAAHLAGVVAAHTHLPVIAVPVASTPLNGMDALLASVQMPAGMPVATVAINGAANAAILSAQILAVTDKKLRAQLEVLRQERTQKVLAADRELGNDNSQGDED